MTDFLFHLFAFVTVLAAAGVVVSRNAVHAALSLLVCFLGVAGLMVQLDAALLAFIFLLVYAGAVVVLFLFVVMLLDVRGGDPRKPYKPVTAAAAVVALALLTAGLLSFTHHGQLPTPGLAGAPAVVGLKEFGFQLFTTYLLPVQVTGFLLLIAMLGVVGLSRRLDADGEGEGKP